MIDEKQIQDFLNFAKECRNLHIPVVREHTAKLLCELVAAQKPKRILELGTAVGYSGTLMLLSSIESQLLTVELNQDLCVQAKQTFERYNVSNRVNIVNDDILHFLDEYSKQNFENEYQKIQTFFEDYDEKLKLEYQKEISNFTSFDFEKNDMCFDEFVQDIKDFVSNGNTKDIVEKQTQNQTDTQITTKQNQNKFDFIFLDGPKGQYIKYYPYLKLLLNDGGVIFCDDVLYFGMIQDDKKVIHKKITIVRNLREFINIAQNDKNFKTKLFDLEDGVLILKKL